MISKKAMNNIVQNYVKENWNKKSIRKVFMAKLLYMPLEDKMTMKKKERKDT